MWLHHFLQFRLANRRSCHVVLIFTRDATLNLLLAILLLSYILLVFAFRLSFHEEEKRCLTVCSREDEAKLWVSRWDWAAPSPNPILWLVNCFRGTITISNSCSLASAKENITRESTLLEQESLQFGEVKRKKNYARKTPDGSRARIIPTTFPEYKAHIVEPRPVSWQSSYKVSELLFPSCNKSIVTKKKCEPCTHVFCMISSMCQKRKNIMHASWETSVLSSTSEPLRKLICSFNYFVQAGRVFLGCQSVTELSRGPVTDESDKRIIAALFYKL